MQRIFLFAFLICLSESQVIGQIVKRPLQPSDIYRLERIGGHAVSPDGNWVLFSLSKYDSVKDKGNAWLNMVSWDGKETVRLTHATRAGAAAWSPDNKYVSFLAAGEGEEPSQIFLMDRRGGEPYKLTSIKGEIQSYDWSPDAKTIVLAITDPNTADTAKTKIRKPYVMDRYQFKRDYAGYLDDRKTHLYLFNVATRKLDTLSRGEFNENAPTWSPDGRSIAFVSNHTPDPDRNENSDLFVIDARPGASAKQLTSFKGTDDRPVWSPDGSRIAYLRSATDADFNMYDPVQLAVLSLAGGEPQVLSAKTDRAVSDLAWSADGKEVRAILEDDRRANIVSFSVAGGSMRKITDKDAVYNDIRSNRSGKTAVLFSDSDTPYELYALDGETPRRITFAQDSFLAPIRTVFKKGFRSTSKDGTSVSSILFQLDSTARKQPTIMFIHGGPVAQDQYDFDFYRQVLASAGFTVAGVNYRGSSGRGQAYAKAIYADWGNKEVLDIQGAVDQLVAQGYSDKDRLGIAGWSYGGILSDYSIASDNRYKAAVSGAGSALQLTMFGTDQYINQYMNELGAPWKSLDKWLKVSYPFLQADKIKTPTLFMASQNDFNVPVAGAEQMYQALKANNVPSRLVIYPGQNHGLVTPSYILDRYQRTIGWFREYLK